MTSEVSYVAAFWMSSAFSNPTSTICRVLRMNSIRIVGSSVGSSVGSVMKTIFWKRLVPSMSADS